MRFHAERGNDRPLRATRDADSIPNHTLKNVLADSSRQTDLCLEPLSTLPDEHAHTLEMSAAALQRGLLACRHRQTYINLLASRYAVARSPMRVCPEP